MPDTLLIIFGEEQFFSRGPYIYSVQRPMSLYGVVNLLRLRSTFPVVQLQATTNPWNHEAFIQETLHPSLWSRAESGRTNPDMAVETTEKQGAIIQ